MMYCHICKTDIDISRMMFTRTHLDHIHHISGKEYYDTYLISDGEGVCHNEHCTNTTQFTNLSTGYRTYCCKSCMQSSEYRQQKTRKTNLIKYGTEFASQNTDIIEKTKKTNIKKYGGIAPALSKIVRDKMQTTVMERYQVDHPMHSPDIVQKMITTNMERFGTECVFSSTSIKNKIIHTNNRKYGTNHPLQNSDIKQKAIITSIHKYGSPHPSQSDIIKLKAKNTIFTRYGVQGTQSVSSIAAKTLQSHRDRYWDIFTLKLKLKNIVPDFSESYFTNINNKKFKCKCLLCNRIIETDQTNALRINCTCQRFKSKFEYEISSWIENTLNISNINRNIKFKNREADIYLPDFKLGIDFHGLYWHNNLLKESTYHQKKLEHFNSLGIDFIQIFENEWVNKRILVENIIKRRLGIRDRIIYARKCEVKDLSNHEYNIFMEENHIQGTTKASIRYGLFYKSELVTVISFAKSRYSKSYEWELIRFANKIGTSVTGSAGKLFNRFIKNNKPSSVISFCDVRLFTGSMYKSLGFNKSHRSKPNYFYFKHHSNILESRIKYQKHKLQSILTTYDPNLSEYDNMLSNGYLRIFDAGNDVYTFINN